MKKLLLLAVSATMLVSVANAQGSADAQSAEQLQPQLSKVYCELVGHAKLLGPRVNVTVDFGQHRTLFQNHFLVDEKGKAITFNSMVDAMNYMSKFGWEFEQAYIIGSNGSYVYHWLLSKYMSDDENINDGFTTKNQFKKIQQSQEKPSQEEMDGIYQ